MLRNVIRLGCGRVGSSGLTHYTFTSGIFFARRAAGFGGGRNNGRQREAVFRLSVSLWATRCHIGRGRVIRSLQRYNTMQLATGIDGAGRGGRVGVLRDWCLKRWTEYLNYMLLDTVYVTFRHFCATVECNQLPGEYMEWDMTGIWHLRR